MRNIAVRILFYLIGICIMTFGASLTIKADLGAGAWDAVNVALSEMSGLTVGNWVIIIGIFLMFTNAMIANMRPDYLALITIFIIGFVIDFWLLIVMADWHFEQLLVQATMLIIGVFILGFGVSLYLQPSLFINPIDGFMVALHKRFGMSLLKAKSITEGLAVLIGFLLGGPVGIGTLLILLFIGPAIQFFEPISKKMLTLLQSENEVIQH
ncbi:YczE/YyaS/YitT family protein [Radiobacillus sp. PE A8.2]|uniref:YczE/YyaS/YitT family protein n=1 Tax=Radiobacillus sp. PE A8.2 TaxID=3380349 RepID=UPI00388EB2EC